MLVLGKKSATIYAMIEAEEGDAVFLEYGEKEIAHLKARDKHLAQAIDQIGIIRRPADTNLFTSVVHHIIGQQISTAAQHTIWGRMKNALGEVTPQAVQNTSVELLQSCGITYRKAEYIKDFAGQVWSGEFDLQALESMPDEQVVTTLCSLKGIGVWTAEMLMIFCLRRPDVVSYGDLAIHRGMRMLYRHRKITPSLFEKYRRRYSPWGSVASLYLWAVAAGALPDKTDPAPAKKRTGK